MSSSILSDINEGGYFKPFVNISSVDIGEKYTVLNVARVSTKFGEKIQVECMNFKTTLPNRYLEVFTEEKISEVNKLISETKTGIFLSLTCQVGRTVNLKFTDE